LFKEHGQSALMTGHSGKLLRNTISYLPAQFGPPAAQFAATVIWTHLLDPATFGVVTFVIAAQEITAYIGITAWSMYLLRFRSRFGDGADERFRSMDKRMAIAACLIQFLLAFPLLHILNVPLTPPILIATTAYLVSRSLLTHYGEWARAEHHIGAYTVGQLTGSVVAAALSIIAILLLGPFPEVALGAQAIGQILALLLVYRRMGIGIGFGTFDATLFRDMCRFSLPMIVALVVGWGATNVNRVIVQYMEGAVALGLMSVGWGLGQRIAAVIAMTLTAAAYPLAIQQYERGDKKGALAQISLNGVFLLALLAPAVAGATTLVAPIVNLLIAENFREMTIAMFPVAMAASAVRSLRLHTADQAMLLLEHTNVSMSVTIIESILNVALCVIGLHVGGLYGAALGMLAGASIACLGGLAYAFWALELPVFSPSLVLRVLLATGVMTWAVVSAPAPSTAIGLALAIMLGAIVYVGATLVLFPECRALVTRRFRPNLGASAT
jgi:O-antigen/teichoic acid export membrane protein